MKTYSTEKIRNIVLLGNAGSGKTTLAEAMMFEGKVIDRRGSVEAKNTVSDSTDVEHQYLRSIYSTLLYTEFMDRKLNFMDTPGSDDFVGGVFSAFKVCDTGIMVINAQNGVEVGTEIFSRYAERHNKPIIIAVNQLDQEKADFESTLAALQFTFEKKVVLVQYPLVTGPDFDGFVDVLKMKLYKFNGDSGERQELEIPASEIERAQELHQKLVEAAAEHEEELMELFFDKGSLDEEEIRRGLRAGMSNRSIFPLFCLSAKKNIGIKRLMEFIINVAPSPEKGRGYKTTEDLEIPCDASAVPSLFVFKTSVEQHLGEVNFFRVMSGKITEGMELTNANNGTKEKISQLFVVAGKNRQKVTEVVAGDIACTVKLKNTKTNHTLNGAGKDWVFHSVKYPAAKFRTAIKAKNTSEEEKLNELLNRFAMEDQTFLVEYSKELKQTIISGQGEHHINIIRWHLNNVHKLETDLIEPKIPYRETITKISAGDYRHRKQSGGAGQFGEVHLLVMPHIEGAPDQKAFKVDGKDIILNIKGKDEVLLDWGGKLIFYNCVVGGAIDTRFLPAILKGLMEKMEEGPLTGSYARDIRVACYDGKMHPVDSNEISFKLAARNAFKTAFKNAGPKIMEPIYDIEVLVPGDYLGDIMSDLQNRRAIIMGMSSDKGFEILKARVPLAEMHKYSTALSSMTSGRATYTMKYSDYQQVPAEVQDKLLKAYAETEKEE